MSTLREDSAEGDNTSPGGIFPISSRWLYRIQMWAILTMLGGTDCAHARTLGCE